MKLTKLEQVVVDHRFSTFEAIAEMTGHNITSLQRAYERVTKKATEAFGPHWSWPEVQRSY